MRISSILSGRNDLDIYERHADEWWDPKSPRFKSLQKITKYRFEQICTWFGDLEGACVVDMGCGGGLLSIPLLDAGGRVIALDISPASVRVAQQHADGRGEFLVADVCDTNLADGIADFVVIADVLDHIPHYDLALKEAARLLKPGGKLYVNTINRTPASWFLAVFLGELLRLIPPGTHDYRLLIKPAELIAAASVQGLKKVAIQGEAPIIGKTARDWAIHFRDCSSTAVAYSTLFSKDVV
jgi:2-polyprenyl-6-hydroxyphenyl methylase/3-demethylubiquinone-9 3-methyltransferase